jgi:hypothetical protein
MINMKNLVDMMVIVVIVIGKFAHFTPFLILFTPLKN